jgi:hypothetical protein
MKARKDEAVAGEFAKGLKKALVKNRTSPEEAAQILGVELGILYKYLAGAMIPGGKVLWLACMDLGMILDSRGFRPRQKAPNSVVIAEDAQSAFPFMNESIEGEKIRAHVRKKDNQYVVSLRIKVAG